MGILIHPDPGSVLICDFRGFEEPEIIKRRPVVVVSPRFKTRDGLCTVVPLSTTAPRKPQPYHCTLRFDPVLPAPYSEPEMWVKGDMLATVAFGRLSLPFIGKDGAGKRQYDLRRLDDTDLRAVRACILNGIGLDALTAGL